MDEILSLKLKTYFIPTRITREESYSPELRRAPSPPKLIDEIMTRKNHKAREQQEKLLLPFVCPEKSPSDKTRHVRPIKSATYLDPPHPIFQKVRLASGKQDIPRFLRCMGCNTLMQECIILECNHRFCPNCILKADDMSCPHCGATFITSEVRPGIREWEMLKQIKIKCPNVGEGCSWEGLYSSLEEHLKTCTENPVPCRNSHRGCDFANADPAARAEHFRSCEYADFVCVYCGELMYFKQNEEHLVICGFKPVSCIWCNEEMEARKMAHHTIYDCQEAPMVCPIPGCEAGFKGNRTELRSHVHETFGVHLKLFAQHYRTHFSSIVHREVVYRVNYFLARCGMNFNDNGEPASTLDGFDAIFQPDVPHTLHINSEPTPQQLRIMGGATANIGVAGASLELGGDARYVDPKVLPTPSLVAGILESHGNKLDLHLNTFRTEVVPVVDKIVELAKWVEKIDGPEFERILGIASFVRRGLSIIESGLTPVNEHFKNTVEMFVALGQGLRDDVRMTRKLADPDSTQLPEQILRLLLKDDDEKYRNLVVGMCVRRTERRMVSHLMGTRKILPEWTVYTAIPSDDEVDGTLTEQVTRNVDAYYANVAHEVKNMQKVLYITKEKGAEMEDEPSDLSDSDVDPESEYAKGFSVVRYVTQHEIDDKFNELEELTERINGWVADLEGGVGVEELEKQAQMVRSLFDNIEGQYLDIENIIRASDHGAPIVETEIVPMEEEHSVQDETVSRSSTSSSSSIASEGTSSTNSDSSSSSEDSDAGKEENVFRTITSAENFPSESSDTSESDSSFSQQPADDGDIGHTMEVMNGGVDMVEKSSTRPEYNESDNELEDNRIPLVGRDGDVKQAGDFGVEDLQENSEPEEADTSDASAEFDTVDDGQNSQQSLDETSAECPNSSPGVSGEAQNSSALPHEQSAPPVKEKAMFGFSIEAEIVV